MSFGLFRNDFSYKLFICKSYIYIGLKNLQRLIYHKTLPTNHTHTYNILKTKNTKFGAKGEIRKTNN